VKKWVVKQMKASEFRNLTSAEIEQKISGFKEELFNLRFQLATGQLDNPTRIRNVRKEIARAKTIIHERLLGIS
jgi:large subunit ribosomal protein L29